MFSSPMNAKLFINYRRDDTAPYAGRLYDRLIAHFGEDQVFIDIDQIEPGEDFVEVINRKVGTCDIAIVAIGPHWLGATDASGKRRLDDEEDFVRMEIVAALQRNIRVIPVLVGGAQMPRKQDLPEPLAPLSRRNAIELSETRFHADVKRLIEAIEKSFAVVAKKTELSATPVAPPAEPASIRSPDSKDRTTPVKSTQTTPVIPPVVSSSLVAALKEPAVWIRKRLIIVAAIAATVVLLLAITWSLTRPHPSVGPSEPSKPAEPKSTNQGDAAAQYNLGVRYEDGQGVPKDVGKAADLYQKAANQGHAGAQFNLGLLYVYGRGVSKDLGKAAELFQKAANQGHAGAQNNLAWLYENGWGVPQDFGKATELYQKAANQGNQDAIANLKRLSKPAEPKQGDAATQFSLALQYENGEGVPKDLGKAAELYQKAADQGNAAAQNNLGALYENGEGVPKDLRKAAELYQKAAKQDNQPAIANLKRLSKPAETPAERPLSQSEFTGGYDPAIATLDMQRIFKEYRQNQNS